MATAVPGRPQPDAGIDLPNAYARESEKDAGKTQAVEKRSRFRDLLRAPLAIVGVSLFIVLLDNGSFWKSVLEATARDEHRSAIVASMFLILFCTLVVVQSLAVGTRLLKIVGTGLLVAAAGCGYFMSEYGIVVDPSMIRNVVETQVREVSPLLTLGFFGHLLAFGGLPALLLLLLPFGRPGRGRALAVRAALIALSTVVLAGTVYANFGPVSFFAHEHHTARLFINPGYPIYSYIRFLTRDDDRVPEKRLEIDARIVPYDVQPAKPTLVVFVVGETARADRFSFNGYARDTNRYTRARGVVNFGNVTSCGTSTADSVPCMFSHLNRDNFSHAEAAAHENVFGTLQRLGIGSVWRDNSTGCKDVCDPEHFEEFAVRTDADLCDATGCFDEILLKDIDGPIADRSQDHFVVLHQRGSHGPAYHTDTPSWAKDFLPECDLPNPRNCDLSLINNAYDNTILYTDYFLSKTIDYLEQQTDDFNVALLYVSDHGESLGEDGLYLHGFPYAIAPPEQTQVPLLFWASPGFYASNDIDAGCVSESTERLLSHDSIYHTLLKMFGVETTRYREDLDLLAVCRHETPASFSTDDNGTLRQSHRGVFRGLTVVANETLRFGSLITL